MSEFERFWNDRFGDTPPLGYRLRERFANSRWVRFHSLPGSKRYAENEDEWAVLLHRANTIADRVLGADSDCWMVTSDPADECDLDPPDIDIKQVYSLEREYFWRDPMAAPEDQILWTSYAAKGAWRPGYFEPAIRAIADDRERSTLWVSGATGAIFAPYDGGIDVITSNETDVAALKGEFSIWLSRRRDGL